MSCARLKVPMTLDQQNTFVMSRGLKCRRPTGLPLRIHSPASLSMLRTRLWETLSWKDIMLLTARTSPCNLYRFRPSARISKNCLWIPNWRHKASKYVLPEPWDFRIESAESHLTWEWICSGTKTGVIRCVADWDISGLQSPPQKNETVGIETKFPSSTSKFVIFDSKKLNSLIEVVSQSKLMIFRCFSSWSIPRLLGLSTPHGWNMAKIKRND